MNASLAERVASRMVSHGHVSVWWLGGSGFIFKTASGKQVWIDPYISNVVAQIFGQERAFPAPITVEQAAPDFVISTHLHEDHLDPGFIPELARKRPMTRFVMPPTAMGRARTWGVPQSQIITLTHGETKRIDDVSVTSVPARHVAGPGFEAPDAMGIILETENLRLYHSGDTEYDVRIRELGRQKFSFATFCINGISGNMNAYEAALLAWHFDVKIVVPHHHLLWAKRTLKDGETLNPEVFREIYYLLGGKANVVLPEIGGEIDVTE
jgi:L-ascorbate metabolism protein UlaG (beta-lactamase superfamily)